MSTIIDHTYFKGDINIPNIAPGKPGGDNLDWHIQTYESEYVTRLLGLNLADSLIAGVSGVKSGAVMTGANFDLLKGAAFIDSNGNRNKWCGLIGDTIGEDYKFSPIANYVYWQRMRQRSSQTVGIGEVISRSENSVPISPADKMVRAWNKMVDWNWILHDFICSRESVYPDYIGLNTPPLPNPPNNYKLFDNQALFVKQNTFGL